MVASLCSRLVRAQVTERTVEDVNIPELVSRVSQHFFDPYSFCHILHGFIFYGLWGWWPELVWGRAWWWVWLAGAGLAVLAELCHEIIENSEWVIQLYRSNSGTSSQYEVSTTKALYDYATSAFLAGEFFALALAHKQVVSTNYNYLLALTPMETTRFWVNQEDKARGRSSKLY